jgi:hypothetical protein
MDLEQQAAKNLRRIKLVMWLAWVSQGHIYPLGLPHPLVRAGLSGGGSLGAMGGHIDFIYVTIHFDFLK